ncbi:MAG: hypothetical protein PHO46_05330 [Thermoguttaceae bacterium]|nr:hypothetical protein [Thermoguttaceae bacterium]
MSIIVTCPNGHRLTAPDKRAGTTGRCPACGATVLVPEQKNAIPSDSSILRIMGVGADLRKALSETAPEEELFSAEELPKKTIQKKICPQCDWEIDAAFKICPKCRYYFIK